MTTWLVAFTTADILVFSFEYYCVDVNVGRLVEMSRMVSRMALREAHVVFNLWCFSPQVQITTSTCGDIVHGWVEGQGAQHKWANMFDSMCT